MPVRGAGRASGLDSIAFFRAALSPSDSLVIIGLRFKFSQSAPTSGHHRNADKVDVTDAPAGGVEIDPADARQKDLHPGVGRAILYLDSDVFV